MKKITLFFIAFLAGLFFFFPYKSLYSKEFRSFIKENNLPITFEVSKASIKKADFSKIVIMIDGRPLVLNDVKFKFTPVDYLLNKNAGVFSTTGVEVEYIKREQSYHLGFNIKDFRNVFFGQAIITSNGNIVTSKNNLKDGNIYLFVKNIELPLGGGKILINEIDGNIKIEKGEIHLNDLTVKGPLDIQLKGTISPNFRSLDMSMINIKIRYKMGENTMEHSIKGTFNELTNIIDGFSGFKTGLL